MGKGFGPAEPEPIPRHLRTARHIERVVLRNLDVVYVRSPVDCFYTLSVGTNSPPLQRPAFGALCTDSLSLMGTVTDSERDPFYISPIEEKTLVTHSSPLNHSHIR
jgi:hypothetical protein